MRSDRAMQDLAPPHHLLAIPAKEVARLAHCDASERWAGQVETGIAQARALIAPRARVAAISASDLDGIFQGGTPVEAIARRGEGWIFIATIGRGVEARVRECFDDGRYLEGVILDAAGSAAVEALCDLVERSCAGEGPSARFSPGYCMWRLDSQRGLFAALRPEEIGIRLLPSMLMHPLKSVSGIVVRAPREALLVPAEVCEQCDAQGCTRRGVT